MSLKIRHLLLVAFLGVNHFAIAQGQGRSPYSAIGVGDLTDETNAAQDGMGGTGVSFGNTFYVNNLNPALLSKDRMLNGFKYVALNVSGKGYYRNLQQGTKINDDFDANLSNLSLAFPVSSRLAFGVNFKPYSIVDHEVSTRKNFEGSSSIGSYSFSNKGAMSKAGITISGRPYKNLYLGIEGQYFFGNITSDTMSTFVSSNIYNKFSTRHDLKGVSLKGGIAYQQKISQKWQINVGGTYQLGNDLKGERIYVNEKLIESANGPTLSAPGDTLGFGNFTTSLPARYRVGLSLEKKMNWVFAAEYAVVDWDAISKPFDQVAARTMSKSQEVGIGVEYIPNASSAKYFNQVFYRAGFKAKETPYTINNTRIKDNSFSIGLSLPLGKGGNYLDLATSVGRRGTVANDLVKEDYVQVSVSFSLMRDWFHRPRIE